MIDFDDDTPGLEGDEEPCVYCGHPVAWFEEIGDYRHVDPERVCWQYQRALADETDARHGAA